MLDHHSSSPTSFDPDSPNKIALSHDDPETTIPLRLSHCSQKALLAQRLTTALDLLTRDVDQRYLQEVFAFYSQRFLQSRDLQEAYAIIGEVERLAFHIAQLQPPIEYYEREIPLAPCALRSLNAVYLPSAHDDDQFFTAHLTESLARVPINPHSLRFHGRSKYSTQLFHAISHKRSLSAPLTHSIHNQPNDLKDWLEHIRAQICSPQSIDHLRQTIKTLLQLKSRGRISPHHFSLLIMEYRKAVARLKDERSARLAPLLFSLIDQRRFKEAAKLLSNEALQGNRQVVWSLTLLFKRHRPTLYAALQQRWRAAATHPRRACFVRWAAYINKKGVPNDPTAIFHLLTKEDRMEIWKLALQSHSTT